MKRSEMVLIFQDIIQERFGFEDAPIFLADALLTAVEEAGMEPPQYQDDELGDIMNFYYVGGWEPEHE